MSKYNKLAEEERIEAREVRPDDDGGRHATAGSRRSFLASLGAAGAGVALAGCLTGSDSGGLDPEEYPPEEHTEWGETAELGTGEVTTFVSVHPDSGERVIGAEMTPGVLEEDASEHEKYVVDFPDSDEVPFSWLGLDWEPGGHYPGDKYAIPHLDWHFYFAPHEQIKDIPTIAMPPSEYSEDEYYTEPLPMDQVPENYFRTNYVFGYMGEHLYDETEPEYNDGTFGNTFVYGHWENELIFMEPMITVPYFEQLMSDEEPELDQLKGKGHTHRKELSMPERFPEAGEYPTESTVKYHEDEDVFTITQHTFEQFEETQGMDAGTLELDDHPQARGFQGDSDGGDGQDHEDADAVVAVAPGGDLVFEPETVEVSTGDTVVFEWEADFHNVLPTSQPSGASWEGEPEISDTGHTHEHTFEVAGEYKYVCEPHASQGMKGTVVVNE